MKFTLVESLEFLLELLQEHVRSCERASNQADLIVSKTLDKQARWGRRLISVISQWIGDFQRESIEIDLSKLSHDEQTLISDLFLQHATSIDEAAEAGDFLTERVLADMRDVCRAHLQVITTKWDE